MHIVLGRLGILTGVVICSSTGSTDWWFVYEMLGGGV